MLLLIGDLYLEVLDDFLNRSVRDYCEEQPDKLPLFFAVYVFGVLVKSVKSPESN